MYPYTSNFLIYIMSTPLQDSDSTVRKEIFEYLRNVQKETEIRARLSGINIWILYGAMGFIVWSLLDQSAKPPSDTVVHLAVFACQLAFMYLFLLALSSTRDDETEVRFRPAWMASQTNLSKLWCAKFGWLAIPYVVSAWLYGLTLSTASVSVMMVLSIVFELYGNTASEAASMLSPSKEERIYPAVLYGIIGVAVLYENRETIWLLYELNRSDVKTLILLIVLYFLFGLLITRSIANVADAWTYALEKKLLLGLCTNAEALATIESNSIGARLLKVIETRRRNVSSSEQAIGVAMSQVDQRMGEIEKISPDYRHERMAQYTAVAAPVGQEIGRFENAISALQQFNDNLAARNKQLQDKRIEGLIEDLATEIQGHKSQVSKLRRVMVEYERRLLGSDSSRTIQSPQLNSERL